MDMDNLIPIVAILATFSVPVTAIIMDYRKRRLQFDERRAMIERGMQPPPMADMGHGEHGTLEQRREKSLRSGVVLLSLGLGLVVASLVLQSGLVQSFIPRQVAGPMSVGAAVLAFLGIGNLVYYAISAPKKDAAE